MLTINQSIQPPRAEFALDGRLDTATAADLEKALRDALDGISELVFNFEKLEY